MSSFLRCSFVPSFLRSFVPSFLRSFVPSFFRSFVPSFLRSFVPSFLRSFVPSFLRSFVPSFLRSFVPSFLPSSSSLLLRCFTRCHFVRFVCSLLQSLPPSVRSLSRRCDVAVAGGGRKLMRSFLPSSLPSSYLLHLSALNRCAPPAVGPDNVRHCFVRREGVNLLFVHTSVHGGFTHRVHHSHTHRPSPTRTTPPRAFSLRRRLVLP